MKQSAHARRSARLDDAVDQLHVHLPERRPALALAQDADEINHRLAVGEGGGQIGDIEDIGLAKADPPKGVDLAVTVRMPGRHEHCHARLAQSRAYMAADESSTPQETDFANLHRLFRSLIHSGRGRAVYHGAPVGGPWASPVPRTLP